MSALTNLISAVRARDTKLAHPKLLAIFRIMFSVFTLWTIGKLFFFYELYWYNITIPVVDVFMHVWLAMWAVVVILVGLGVGGRWIGLLQLIMSVFIMRNMFSFGIFEATHLINSLMIACVRTDEKWSLNSLWYKSDGFFKRFSLQPIKQTMGPVFLVVMHFALIFCWNGLTKLVDPYWSAGYGFYIFSIMPWTLPEYLDWVPDVEWLVVFCNWAAIIAELLFPLFLLIKPLRFWGAVLAMLLFVGLCYPFNIYIIGPMAVTFGIAVFSICEVPWRKSTKLKTLAPEDQPEPGRVGKTRFVVFGLYAICIIAYNTVGTYKYFTYNDTRTTADWPAFESLDDLNERIYEPIEMSAATELLYELHLADLFDPHVARDHGVWQAFKPFSFFKTWFIRPGPYSLFTSKHLVGTSLYRVVVKTKDGRTLEPYRFFQKSKERGTYDRYPLNINILQAGMYMVTDLGHYMSYGVDVRTTRQMWEKMALIPLVQMGVRYSELPLSEIESASILYAQIEMPMQYEGRINWPDDDWQEWFVWEADANRYKYVNIPPKTPQQGRVSFLPNYIDAVWKE